MSVAENTLGKYRSEPSESASGGSARANDPLAELARLIGQEDPFADFGRDQKKEAAQPAGSHSDPNPFDTEFGSAPLRGFRPETPYEDAPSIQGGYEPLSAYEHNSLAIPQHDPQAYAGPADSYGSAHDSAAYAAASHAGHPEYSNASGYDDGRYYADEQQETSGEEERPRRRRAAAVAVAAVVGLAVVGTAGAFAYRSMPGSGSVSNGQAPVIKADTAPLKVPGGGAQQTADVQPNKLIYDRLPDKNEAERVVPREEQPVDVKEATRSISLASGSVNPIEREIKNGEANVPQLAAGNSKLVNDASKGAGAGANANANEPKKVKTVRVRPDLGPAGENAGSRAQGGGNAKRSADTNSGAVGSTRLANVRTGGGSQPLSLAPREDADAGSAQTQRLAARSSGNQGTSVNAAGSGFVVQVAAQKSEGEAQASYRALQTKFPSVLGSRSPIIKRADLGDRGVYYRAQVGPFTSSDQANQFCSNLKSAGGQCIVQRN